MRSTTLTRIARSLGGLATALTVAGLLATPSHGQDHGQDEWKGVAQFVAEGRFQDGEPGDIVVWHSGRFADGLIVPLDVASARRELARLEADALIDRAWTPALEALLVLRTRAVFSNDDADARLELLVDMARTEIGWCLDLGNPSAAHSATRHVLLCEAPASVLAAEQVDEVDALARRFLAHPEIVALRASLAERLPSIEPGLEKTVREAVADDDSETLDQLGSRALPVLDMLARSEATVPGDASHDPLFYMLRLDAGRGIDLMRELLESGDVLPVRVLALLDAWRGWLAPKQWPEFWAVRKPRPPRLRDADLLRVLELCFEQPAPATSVTNLYWGAVLDVLRSLATLDALTPELARILGRHLAEAAELPDWVVRRLVLQDERRPSWFPVLEELLAHPADSVRAMAAEALADFPRSDALRARVADDEPRVRRALARSLQQRDVREGTFGGPLDTPSSTLRPLGPEIGEAERAILRELVRDMDSEVRVEAARAIAALDEPLEPRVYSALADDVMGEVRLVMAGLVHPDAAVLGDVLERLASDADPAVRMAVAQRRDQGEVGAVVGKALVVLSGDPDPSVRQIAAVGLVTEAQFSPSMDTVLGLLDDPDPAVRREVVYQARAGVVDVGALLRKAIRDPDKGVLEWVDDRLVTALRGQRWQGWSEDFLACMDERVLSLPANDVGLLARLQETPQGLQALARWALRLGHPDFWRAAIPSSPQPDDVAAWKGLDDGLFVAWWSAVAERDAKAFRQFAFLARETRAGLDEQDTSKLRLVFEQPELTAHARAGALLAISGVMQPADVPWLRDQLRQIGNEAAPDPSADTLQLVEDAATALAGDVVNPLALSLLEGLLNDYGLGEGVSGRVLTCYRAELEHGETITRRLLRRYSGGDGRPSRRYYRPEGPRFPAVSVAVRALGLHPEAAEPGFLAEATRGVYAQDALRAMARLKDPEHVEALGQCLTPTWETNDSAADSLRHYAVAALVEQMSDAAVQELLAGAARCSNTADREQIMAGVSQIQQFQQALSQWERRIVEGQGRDGAIVELLELLAHDEPLVRAEAARGLATLGAVDQLPRLIRVLADDPSAEVRAAAKVALDQLNAAAARPAAGEGDAGTSGESATSDEG